MIMAASSLVMLCWMNSISGFDGPNKPQHSDRVISDIADWYHYRSKDGTFEVWTSFSQKDRGELKHTVVCIKSDKAEAVTIYTADRALLLVDKGKCALSFKKVIGHTKGLVIEKAELLLEIPE
jgi:hypothetical protein